MRSAAAEGPSRTWWVYSRNSVSIWSLKEKLKAFEERLVEERKKRMEERKKQRKEDRRNTFYRQKEEEAQRIHEEQLKKGSGQMIRLVYRRQMKLKMKTLLFTCWRPFLFSNRAWGARAPGAGAPWGGGAGVPGASAQTGGAGAQTARATAGDRGAHPAEDHQPTGEETQGRNDRTGGFRVLRGPTEPEQEAASEECFAWRYKFDSILFSSLQS